MKKLIILLISVISIIEINATDTEKYVRNLNRETGRNRYNGVASDTLTPNQDSLLYYWKVNKINGMKYSFIVDADSIAGMDTTLAYDIVGRNDEELSWTTIVSGTVTAFNDTVVELKSHSSDTYTLTQANSTIAAYEVTIDTVLNSGTLDTLNYPQQTITNGALTLTTTSIEYIWVGIRLHLAGENDATGTGYEIQRVKLIGRIRGL